MFSEDSDPISPIVDLISIDLFKVTNNNINIKIGDIPIRKANKMKTQEVKQKIDLNITDSKKQSSSTTKTLFKADLKQGYNSCSTSTTSNTGYKFYNSNLVNSGFSNSPQNSNTTLKKIEIKDNFKIKSKLPSGFSNSPQNNTSTTLKKVEIKDNFNINSENNKFLTDILNKTPKLHSRQISLFKKAYSSNIDNATVNSLSKANSYEENSALEDKPSRNQRNKKLELINRAAIDLLEKSEQIDVVVRNRVSSVPPKKESSILTKLLNLFTPFKCT